jgi:hypothetical protein
MVLCVLNLISPSCLKMSLHVAGVTLNSCVGVMATGMGFSVMPFVFKLDC